MYMYECIVNATKEKVVPRTDFTAIIPSGTAIQNVRTSYIGDNLTKDTYHLNSLGRVIAGYTLYSVLTGEPLTQINLTNVTKAMSSDTEVYLLTDKEKEEHPEHETTGGYLKKLKSAQKRWDTLSNNDRKIITSLPNFDAKIFEEITGIKINESEEAKK